MSDKREVQVVLRTPEHSREGGLMAPPHVVERLIAKAKSRDVIIGPRENAMSQSLVEKR